MKRFIVTTAILFAAALLLGIGYLGWLAWRRSNMPLYAFSQQPAPDGQFTNSFLSSGGVRYLMTRPEYSLELMDARFGYPLIGRTADNMIMDIYAVPGNTEYIFMTGFMNPAMIFRKESASPVDLTRLPITEMRYIAKKDNQRVDKSTSDQQLIAEVVRVMQTQPGLLPTNREVYHIELLTPNLPGLVYSIYVVYGPTGAVYLAPLYDDMHGVPAGPLFTRWLNQ